MKFRLWLTVLLVVSSVQASSAKEPARQYEFKEIIVPAATAKEAKLKQVSVKKALDYLEKGASAWSKARKCVSCHTNGSYMLIRPALTAQLGTPSSAMRDFFVEDLNRLQAMHDKNKKALLRSTHPTRVAYIAAGLAQWDKHVSKELSPQTSRALRLMFEIQSRDGAWGNLDCWPPLESSRYHGATVAAMAIAIAPGWLQQTATAEQRQQTDRLKEFLRTATLKNDYERTLLLWTSSLMPDLIGRKRQEQIIARVLKLQRPDGGWSLRTFSDPEKWGKGNRAKKLKEEPGFKSPASDGHQTGLVLIVLRDAGVPADHPQLQRGGDWLLANQRVSGRWWTRSLNTDRFHFITYSGTIYPLLALHKLGRLPKADP